MQETISTFGKSILSIMYPSIINCSFFRFFLLKSEFAIHSYMRYDNHHRDIHICSKLR